MVDII
jgi:YHS domain-containing protein